MSELKVNKISPATGTAFTLGDSGDTFTVPSGATITNSGTATGFGGGKVLQTIMVEKTDTYTQTASSFTLITGLAVTITPSATSSKILITGMVNVSGNSTYASFTRLMRDSTVINIGDAAGSRQRASHKSRVESLTNVMCKPLSFLDSPSTTSAVVYSVQGWAESGNTFCVNRSKVDTDAANHGRYASQIIVQEIGV